MDFLALKPEFSRRLSRIFFSASSRLSRNFRGRLAGLAEIAAAGRLSRRLRGLESPSYPTMGMMGDIMSWFRGSTHAICKVTKFPAGWRLTEFRSFKFFKGQTNNKVSLTVQFLKCSLSQFIRSSTELVYFSKTALILESLSAVQTFYFNQ